MLGRRAHALLGFHALTGTDNTGKFAGIRKHIWFCCPLRASDDMIDALAKLSINEELSNDQLFHIEEFVCLGYSPKKPKILQAAK